MKVLFIGREKDKGRLSPILLAQGESLARAGVTIHYFPIKGKGMLGYLSAVRDLKKLIRSTNYDIFHAHYYASGIAASLSGAQPLVISIMGSELKSGWATRLIVNLFISQVWKNVIVKSDIMLNDIWQKNKVIVIPNGVDMALFRSSDKTSCQKQVDFDTNLRHILFLSDPGRKEKNFKLAQEAVKILGDSGTRLHVLHGIEHERVPVYMSAADLLLLTSYHEGSPNVVKEAMACNLPVVSTTVGDVPDIIKGTEGCYLAGYEPSDVADKISRSLAFNSRTDGRNRIGHLDSQQVAGRLINLYKSLFK